MRADRLVTMSQSVDSAVSAVRAYIEQHRAVFLDDLAEWLPIPSVSAQSDHAPDVRRSADWLAAKLRETGFPTTEVWETPGAPAVFAEWPAADPGAPTVLVHGHHYVQPTALEDGWDSEPFEPVVHDNRLHARGAALQSVARAMGRAFGRPIRFTREGGSGPAADLQEVLGTPVLSWASPSPRTAGTRRTRRPRSTCSSRASRPPRTCGATSRTPGVMRPEPPAPSGTTPRAGHTGGDAPHRPAPVAARRTPRRTARRNNPLPWGSWKHP